MDRARPEDPWPAAGSHRGLPRRRSTIRPDFGEAWWSLANLKTYRFSDEEFARMRAAEAAPTTTDGRPLSPVLRAGQGAGGPGRIRRFLAVLRTRQRAQARGNPLSAARSPKSTPGCRRWYALRSSSPRAAAGAIPDPDPIFVVGLPRSGSTLIEQILASHSQVEGTQELADIQRIVMELRGRAHRPREPALSGQCSRN